MRMVDGLRGWMVLVALVFALGAFGCDGDGGGGSGGSDTAGGADVGGGGGGSGSQPAENCPERCATRATECGAPAALVEQLCAGICDENPTEDQARCLEAEDCDVLEQSFLGGPAPCGIGEDGGDDGADDGSGDGA